MWGIATGAKDMVTSRRAHIPVVKQMSKLEDELAYSKNRTVLRGNKPD